MLSGWPYFNAPWPSVVNATSRWYDPETVELAEAMSYNFIWLTFNVGYSIDKERHQWNLLRAYVDACHAKGIRVAAYMSSTNMFVDDMLFSITERVQSGKDNFAVHLLNYRKHPLVNVRVRCPGVKKLHLLSLSPGCEQIRKGTKANEWVIPKLGVYSILAVKD